jgi:hypothetical protein
LNTGGFKADSQIFHRYAEVAAYAIDTNRITLTFTINLKCAVFGLSVGKDIPLSDFLTFCYQRITKVDDERRYCKHYCQLLDPLKETGAWFEFWHEGQRLEPGVEPICLSDLSVPGSRSQQIVEINRTYDPLSLVPLLEAQCGGHK